MRPARSPARICRWRTRCATHTSTTQDKAYTPWIRVEGTVLYWVPEAAGLETYFGKGASQYYTSGGIETTISTETDTDPSFRWNAGYRIELGGQFTQNHWEVDGIWTAFQSYGSKDVNHNKWKVRLKQLDLATLYDASFSSVHLQPLIGLRATSIFQTLFSKITTSVDVIASGTATDTRTFDDRQQFYGFGPLFGLNSSYVFKYGMSIYGNIALSLLYGNYHLHFDDHEVITAPATPSQISSKIHKSMHAFDLDVDLALGIQWAYLIRNRCNMTMKLGLENHQYLNQSRLGSVLGNLSFSGGIYSLGLAF